MAPLVGSSSRLQQRNSVLLPEPDGPMMKTSSCGATFSSMPRSTSVAPKVLRSAWTCRMGEEGTDFTPGHSGARGPKVRREPGIHNHDALGSIESPGAMDPGLRGGPSVPAAPGCHLPATRLVLGRIVARHAGHAV